MTRISSILRQIRSSLSQGIAFEHVAIAGDMLGMSDAARATKCELASPAVKATRDSVSKSKSMEAAKFDKLRSLPACVIPSPERSWRETMEGMGQCVATFCARHVGAARR